MFRGVVIQMTCWAMIALCLGAARAVTVSDNPNRQFVNISPLPGGGIAINSEGKPDGLGAVQINIPVAYTPTKGYLTAGAYFGKGTKSDTTLNNLTGNIGIGFGEKPTAYVSVMAFTKHVRSEGWGFNAQVQVVQESEDRPGVVVGVQDAFKGAEQKGYSAYIAATKAFPTSQNSVYLTIGAGGGRFTHTAFAGLSYPAAESVNLIAEWDGFQFNGGVAWRPSGRDGRITLLGGYNGQVGALIGVGGVIPTGSFM